MSFRSARTESKPYPTIDSPSRSLMTSCRVLYASTKKKTIVCCHLPSLQCHRMPLNNGMSVSNSRPVAGAVLCSVDGSMYS